MLPFNEIGRAREKRLVGDGSKDSESYGLAGIASGGWLGLKLRGRSELHSFGICWHEWDSKSWRGKVSQGEYAEELSIFPVPKP